MSLQGVIADREHRAAVNRSQAERDAAARAWMRQDQAPEARLVAFDRWLMVELEARLDWAWAGTLKEKRQHQCRLQIGGMILELWRRGWMLDGHRLAAHLKGMLDAIGKAQRGGQVRDFWPYFKASVNRYVGLNAEEIQAEAMNAGMAVAGVMQQLTKRLPAGPSITELVAQRTDETLRAKVSRHRAQEARQQALQGQPELF